MTINARFNKPAIHTNEVVMMQPARIGKVSCISDPCAAQEQTALSQALECAVQRDHIKVELPAYFVDGKRLFGKPKLPE